MNDFLKSTLIWENLSHLAIVPLIRNPSYREYTVYNYR